MKNLRLFLIGLAFLLPGVAQANLISNGNFTNCVGCGVVFTTYFGGSTNITDWTVQGHSVDLILTYWQAPPLGGNSVDLDGNAPGGVSQTFSTVIGQQYLVTFYLSGNPDSGDPTKDLRVSAASAFQDYSFVTTGNSHPSMGWVARSFLFSALGTSTTLNFSSLEVGSAFGPAIGNVDVVEAPEPSSLLLIAAAALSLLGFGWLRRQKQA